MIFVHNVSHSAIFFTNPKMVAITLLKKINLILQSTCFHLFQYCILEITSISSSLWKLNKCPRRSQTLFHFGQSVRKVRPLETTRIKSCYKCQWIGCFLTLRVFIFRPGASAHCKIAGRCKIFGKLGNRDGWGSLSLELHQSISHGLPNVAKHSPNKKKLLHSNCKLVNQSPRDGRFAESPKSQATRRNWKL